MTVVSSRTVADNVNRRHELQWMLKGQSPLEAGTVGPMPSEVPTLK